LYYTIVLAKDIYPAAISIA